ncbi:MAG TPA: hypothetical protein VEU74_00750 [Gemmatimonadales bacterium]|nr:hypothetical protein [Gemmatimonadales bacterium]
MTRRRKRHPKARPKARPQPVIPAPPPGGETDPLADARIRPLVERYCGLAGVKRAALGPDRFELSLPEAERPFFRDRASLRVAFSLDALERDPAAEIAVLGSPFLAQLIEAIRARAARLSLGLIAPTLPIDPRGVELTIPVRDGTVQPAATQLAVHPVGGLVARVVLRAGAGVEEAVVESDVYDLVAGARLGDDLAAAFRELEAGRVDPADPALAAAAAAVPAREPADLLRLLLGHLREKSAERVATRRAAAERDLAVELARLDRYFESILAEQGDPESIGTVTALAERRRTEEIRRSEVKAVVHPLQLIEGAVLVQRVEWQLESARGRRATFSAQRPLSGAAAWVLACPHCGRPPATLVVCRHDHCACEACTSRCAVCAEDFCTDHGIAECRVDAQPACDEHVHVCLSCRLEHCTAHEGVCAEDGHTACTSCLDPCASCGRVVCNRHAERSHVDAPKGSRRLCAACLRHCEGGTNEPVGVDEVAQCASCGKAVCTAHQAACVVDGQIHCAHHLRRTDKSGRLVCARHRASCALETVELFASDEVRACASCGKVVCAEHSGQCLEDGLSHCVTHLELLHDANGAYGCAEHRKQCHVDGEVFSLTGVSECPICGKNACARHRVTCAYCGRHVCTTDWSRASRRCGTCTQLAAVSDPPDEVVAASRAATGGERKAARAWRLARDRSHVVVEVDLGLRRKAVFTLRHGATAPDSVMKHSLLGSNRRK